MRSAAACPRSVERKARIVCAPLRANSSAASHPMPLLAPVMMTVFPERSGISSTVHIGSHTHHKRSGPAIRNESAPEADALSFVAHQKCSAFATTTMGSSPRRLGRGASFQEHGHSVCETLFKRVRPVFPPSVNPVSGNKREHPFHHFREVQRFLILPDLAALLAF